MKIVIDKKGLLKQKWFFRIVANNGKVIAHASEHYTNKDDMLWAIVLLKKDLPGSEMIDNSIKQ